MKPNYPQCPKHSLSLAAEPVYLLKPRPTPPGGTGRAVVGRAFVCPHWQCKTPIRGFESDYEWRNKITEADWSRLREASPQGPFYFTLENGKLMPEKPSPAPAVERTAAPEPEWEPE